MNLRAKIALTYIALTVVGIFLASGISSMQIRGYLNEREVQTLVSKLEALHAMVEQGTVYPDSSLASDARLRQIAGDLGVRITLIRAGSIPRPASSCRVASDTAT